MLKLIELFAGIGTQYKAFAKYIDTEVVGISEIDERPIKIYNHLFGDVNNFGDITKISSLPAADVWTYSFPCTDLSVAGNQAGLNGKNSSLLYEVLRLLKTSEKPKVLIMENVANLVSANFIKGFEEWIQLLKEEGYNTSWQKMKGCDYEGGTIRNRVFAISVLNEEKVFIFPKKTPTKKVVRDYLEPFDNSFYVDGPFEFSCEKKFNNTIKIKDYNNGGQGNRIYSIDGQAITFTATGGGKGGSSGLYLREEGICKLSPIEMAKLMGWSREEAIKMTEVATNREIGFVLGNGIELKVFEKIAEAVVNQYFKSEREE
jgi:DNA-cytosine methyltransferase